MMKVEGSMLPKGHRRVPARSATPHSRGSRGIPWVVVSLKRQPDWKHNDSFSPVVAADDWWRPGWRFESGGDCRAAIISAPRRPRAGIASAIPRCIRPRRASS